MSTHANIEFWTNFSGANSEQPELMARLFKHWDGYPENIVSMFEDFRRRMKEKFQKEPPLSHLINDGSELAAQFIREFKPPYGDLFPIVEVSDVDCHYRLYTTYNAFAKDPTEIPWKLVILGPYSMEGEKVELS